MVFVGEDAEEEVDEEVTEVEEAMAPADANLLGKPDVYSAKCSGFVCLSLTCDFSKCIFRSLALSHFPHLRQEGKFKIQNKQRKKFPVFEEPIPEAEVIEAAPVTFSAFDLGYHVHRHHVLPYLFHRGRGRSLRTGTGRAGGLLSATLVEENLGLFLAHFLLRGGHRAVGADRRVSSSCSLKAPGAVQP